VGEQFAFGLQQPGTGADLGQRQVGRGGPGGLLGGGELVFGLGQTPGDGRVDGRLPAAAGAAGAARGLVDRLGQLGVRGGQVRAGIGD
jgi:hypothetical protein